MKHAIGLLELKNITQGILVADAVLKAAPIELIMAQPLCPGKYVVMFSGDVGAVQSAVRSGRSIGEDSVVDEFVLPNIHPQVFPALNGCAEIKELKSLGIIETYSVASAIIAADAAAKAAPVEIIEVRLARGMGGKAIVTLTGDVGAVTAAVKTGSGAVADSGFLVSQLVIAAPHKDLRQALL
ncbi:utilization microcompartments propanediol concentrating carbon dioxide mechanism carboxysome ethanolamine shell [Lucifera butyrica]|uniref:Utilization microcompartments propanediol concentrating carbon dioxide mechanism carboxysome ethanolamine shell n=1 Tax=Lucifera butyrica TaxID=1351585 RepID=A0A498R842_9FIRM|nr:BMC domain-containing protein [Lucifera butyrica]VBB05308.1 utilization microcompartments propanediol concentrating carbon dioxide mechanism carboxysome ethanolamine shell [Lucifera butyrica]